MRSLEPSPPLYRGGVGQEDTGVPDVQGTVPHIGGASTNQGGAYLQGDQSFIEGYRSAEGSPEYEEHLVNDVLPCEDAEGWGIGYYANGYISRAQFDQGSWATATAGTNLNDPANPYHVGAAVANWINIIDDPGSSAGWPYCWKVGVPFGSR